MISLLKFIYFCIFKIRFHPTSKQYCPSHCTLPTNLNKTYLGKYAVLRRKYKNTKTIDMTSTISIQ